VEACHIAPDGARWGPGKPLRSEPGGRQPAIAIHQWRNRVGRCTAMRVCIRRHSGQVYVLGAHIISHSAPRVKSHASRHMPHATCLTPHATCLTPYGSGVVWIGSMHQASLTRGDSAERKKEYRWRDRWRDRGRYEADGVCSLSPTASSRSGTLNAAPRSTTIGT